MESIGGVKYFVSECYEKEWVRKAIFESSDVRLAVCLVENDKYIGNVYMTDIDMLNRSCRSHILIGDREYWGHGYGREALTEALEYMFKERNMHRIQAEILESNVASLKMHQKCGYKVEGLLRDSVFKNGKYQNQYVLSLLENEFFKQFSNVHSAAKPDTSESSCLRGVVRLPEDFDYKQELENRNF